MLSLIHSTNIPKVYNLIRYFAYESNTIIEKKNINEKQKKKKHQKGNTIKRNQNKIVLYLTVVPSYLVVMPGVTLAVWLMIIIALHAH